MNKSDSIVYSSNITNGYSNEWNGSASTGELLETGSYVYIAKTEKGI